MKRNYYLLFITGVLLFSCSKDTKKSELPEYPVDIEQNISLPLSEIAEKTTAIELELTDVSLINPDRIQSIFLCDNLVIVAERERIFVFGIDGKFVRTIGSKGQGPGEYSSIRNVAMDERNKRLFINSMSKIICYDLNGFFLKELPMGSDMIIKDLNYIDGKLLIAAEQIGRKDEKGQFNHSAVYRLNDDLQIIDSCTIQNTYFERPMSSIHPYENFILDGNGTIYIYYSDIYFNMQTPKEVVLRDTLYYLKNNHLIPGLKLKFNNDGIDGGGNKFIHLFNIYRSTRYIFAFYQNENKQMFYYYCYDTETNKGYNMQDGYIDDIHQIEKRVRIYPLNTNTEMFYYWHTHMNPNDLEEPNPTLYIGKLKK